MIKHISHISFFYHIVLNNFKDASLEIEHMRLERRFGSLIFLWIVVRDLRRFFKHISHISLSKGF